MTSEHHGHVLLVDDQPANLEVLSKLLSDQGYRVRAVTSGARALEAARLLPPECILLDVAMPEMDGFETMREIRKIPSLKNLPIIAVTAKAMKGDREKCIEAGAWDYLSKPVDTEQMLAVLRAWLHR